MINPSVVFQIFNTTVDVVINSIHAKNQSLINLLCPQIPNWMSPYLFQFLIDGNAFFCLMGRELFRDQYRFNYSPRAATEARMAKHQNILRNFGLWV